MWTVPGSVVTAHVVPYLDLPTALALRASDRAGYHDTMGCPDPFVRGLDAPARETILEICERRHFVRHTGPRDEERCQGGSKRMQWVLDTLMSSVVRRNMFLENPQCRHLDHFIVIDGRAVATRAVQQLVLARLPTDQDVRHLRVRQAATVQAATLLRGTRERLMQQLRLEGVRIHAEREQARKDLRDALVRRLLLRRVADDVQATYGP